MKRTSLLFWALLLSFGASAQTVYSLPYSTGFESGMGDWTAIDNNADGYTWSTSPIGPSWSMTHSGSHAVGSMSFVPSSAGGAGGITPDDWLVSPAIALTDTAALTWWHFAYSDSYHSEHYSVYVSTTGNTVDDFLATTPIYATTISVGNQWEYLGVYLTDSVGDTVWIAFRHHDCFDQYFMLIDDIGITTGTILPSNECENYVTNLSLSSVDNGGLMVQWNDMVDMAWAVYVDDSLYGITNTCSFYIADPVVAASTGSDNSSQKPTISVRTVCDGSVSGAEVSITANWAGYNVSGNNITCDPYELPFVEDFEDYPYNMSHHLCWHDMGGLSKRIDTTYAHLSSKSLHISSSSNYTSCIITPKLHVPNMHVTVSFWALTVESWWSDPNAVLHVGVQRNYDTFLYDSVMANITEALIVTANEASDWHYCTFSVYLPDTLVGISFKLVGSADYYIDNIQIVDLPESQDSLPPQIQLYGPNSAMALRDTIELNASLIAGDSTGLAWSWSHTLPCTVAGGSTSQQVVYTAVGIDTIVVIATNPFGSDSDTTYVTVGGEPHVSINGVATVFTDDTVRFTALLTAGYPEGVTYNWSSSMAAAGQAWMHADSNQILLVYSVAGTDTITLTVNNALGSITLTRIVNIIHCNAITTFPYTTSFEPFQGDGQECWRAVEWQRSNFYHRTGGSGMKSHGGGDAWLITPPIALPSQADGMMFEFYTLFEYLYHLDVLVSPTGNSDFSAFTDTLARLTDPPYDPNHWPIYYLDSLQLSLEAYGGHTIRIAFHHYDGSSDLSVLGIDDFSIFCDSSSMTPIPPTPDTVWRTVTVTANVDGACQTHGSGVYADSSTVDIGYTMLDSVTDGGHWQFLGWDDSEMDNPRQIVVTSDTAIVALFQWVADSVGIGNIAVDGISIRSIGDRILVKGANEEVRVFDMMGRMVAAAKGDVVSLRVPTAGVYLVRIENRIAKKVVVIK